MHSCSRSIWTDTIGRRARTEPAYAESETESGFGARIAITISMLVPSLILICRHIRRSYCSENTGIRSGFRMAIVGEFGNIHPDLRPLQIVAET